jgi:hypothetical protein
MHDITENGYSCYLYDTEGELIFAFGCDRYSIVSSRHVDFYHGDWYIGTVWDVDIELPEEQEEQ